MKKIRESKVSKFLVYYFSIMIITQVMAPTKAYALTEGPSQPEFNSFTPVSTSDMVDLASGDFNYNIPIMDVGGYPINLAYNSGVTMDQEASWVGLGWNLNIGQINRNMRGLPDDFDGDQMVYENNMRNNETYGGSVGGHVSVMSLGENGENILPEGLGLDGGVNIKYNNYDGFGMSVSGGLSYEMHKNVSVGVQLETSVSEGTSVSPSLSLHAKNGKLGDKQRNLNANVGLSYNSRKGLENFSYGVSISKTSQVFDKFKKQNVDVSASSGLDGSISFLNTSYTPTKRVQMKGSNFLFNLNLGGSAYGIDGAAKFSGYANIQGIDDSEKYSVEKGYGYENTKNATHNDVLDFNREKDRTVNKHTTTLPQTVYTYDIYSIQAQGVSGMFRPYRGQVGYIFDNMKNDVSNAAALGIEIQVGTGHYGFNATYTKSNSTSRAWVGNNNAIDRFTLKNSDNPLYEDVYFKTIGGNHVDNNYNAYNPQGYNAAKLQFGGNKFGRQLFPNYETNYNVYSESDPLMRTERVKRNQTIQKLTRKEAVEYKSKTTQYSEFAKNHHTAEIKVTNENGDAYVFGRALYNVTKKETTFDVSGIVPDLSKGIVVYGGKDNTINNERNGDRYFNRVTTPAYAHTYLITAVLSSDYQDLKNDGLTQDDLGNYTKFEYTDNNQKLYKWRTPFGKNEANYDEGLKSNPHDNKANYIYGEKEIVYIKKITTKTHVAIFSLSKRDDSYGVTDENGGIDVNNAMYKLDKISLYALPEYNRLGDAATPIKEAHFEYDYSLCQGVPNNKNFSQTNSNNRGKLTLRKIYFTYKNSNMGKYTPYVFNYDNNVDYDSKAFDVWGNYKPASNDLTENPTTGSLSNAEFPFVDQTNKALADEYASSWHLNSVKLPSGGELKIQFESDDYGYVQDKEAMEMIKVVGASNKRNEGHDNKLFNLLSQNFYIHLDTGRPLTSIEEFRNTYLKNNLANEDIYFRFLLNMSDPSPIPGGDNSPKYEYVSGYLNLNENDAEILSDGTVSIRVRSVNKGDGATAELEVNPIAKAGWYFGRSNLSRLINSPTGNMENKDLASIVNEIIGAVPSITQLFISPNTRLLTKGIASRFVPNKSWIRLKSPNGQKFGGGSRVKEVKLVDEWDVMTSNNDNPIYEQTYGQTYSYNDTKYNSQGQIISNKSYGVATYEPYGCKENPFVMPFYDKQSKSLLLGPQDQNYVELPFCESYYPSPKVTYSKVTVKNLDRARTEGQNNFVVKKHATGSVETCFFTSKDYPTVVDYTAISSRFDKSPLGSLLKINAKEHLTLSQGFSVHTNDMDGKMKSQSVFAEGQTRAISGTEYKYSNNPTPTNGSGLLNNVVKTIDGKGNVVDKMVGVDVDIINDFREDVTKSITPGVRFNTEGFPLPFVYLLLPVILPTFNQHETKLKCATTTKAIHTSGILREVIAFEDNARVSTKNLAWDADTGQVLLTETVNEYDDNYFSFNMPAYWSYSGMSQAAKNIGMTWNMELINNKYRLVDKNANDFLIPGDEIWVKPSEYTKIDNETVYPFRAWVAEMDANGNFVLIDKDGMLVDQFMVKKASFKVVKSGYKNLQMASMASITSLTNPLLKQSNPSLYVNNITENGNGTTTFLFQQDTWDKYKIINASAVEYDNFWASQCECYFPAIKYNNGKPVYEYQSPLEQDEEKEDKREKSFNPYVYNIQGNWRAKKSYAYLTGRRHADKPTPRVSGFFNDFAPFYTFNGTSWNINQTNILKWTYASEISQYNPFGQEIENKDALNRYSSAIYGYGNKLPLAVASNTRYKELAFDGFEDYNDTICKDKAHFNFKNKDNKVILSSKHAHTGRNSLRISPKDSIKMSKKVSTCNTTTPANRVSTKAKRTK